MDIIRIRELSKSFGDNSVLSGVNLDIAEGEIFGVIGKSGAGKSTLARCINYFERPTSGEIFFEGKPLSSLSKRELYLYRRGVGYIFQQFNLLMQRDVTRNVCFPLEIAGWKRAAARERAAELLELVGLSDKADAYPAKLSGGQKQRVAIARAVAANPRLLISDEATSALDPATTRGILELLRDINRRFGITIIVITHEMEVIRGICGRVAVIDGAHVAEVGETNAVFSNPQSAAAREFLNEDDAALRELRTELAERGLTAAEALRCLK